MVSPEAAQLAASSSSTSGGEAAWGPAAVQGGPAAAWLPPSLAPTPHPAGMREPEVLEGVNQLATARFMHVIAPHADTGAQPVQGPAGRLPRPARASVVHSRGTSLLPPCLCM